MQVRLRDRRKTRRSQGRRSPVLGRRRPTVDGLAPWHAGWKPRGTRAPRHRHAVWRSSPRVDITSPLSKGFCAGFLTGDGSFVFYGNRPRLAVHLRADDTPLLDRFASAAGVGSVRQMRACGSSQPSAAWQVHRHQDMAPLLEWLEPLPLAGRKQRQYEAWRPAAVEIMRAVAEVRRPDEAILDAAAAAFADVSAYRPERIRPEASLADARRARYLAILRSCLAEQPDSVSSNAYTARREPGWPTRNTIVDHFGSWARAIRAAQPATSRRRPVSTS